MKRQYVTIDQLQARIQTLRDQYDRAHTRALQAETSYELSLARKQETRILNDLYARLRQRDLG